MINNLRIIQVVSTFIEKDAIGNEIANLSASFTKSGISNIVVYQSRLGFSNVTSKHIFFYHPKKNDVIIFHMACGTNLVNIIRKKCQNVKMKMMIYHNITPPVFFQNNLLLKNSCEYGYKQIKELTDYFDVVWCDSDFSKLELQKNGYKNVRTLPYFFDYNVFKSVSPSKDVLKIRENGYSNILFVGRIVPNKKIEDVIKSFYIYNKYFNKNSNLFLIGNITADPLYFHDLITFIEKNHISNIFFKGTVSLSELIGYYSIADLFLCESEHEGFCVPLIEAAYFKVPILAYYNSAIPYTLNKYGIMFSNKSHKHIAKLMDMIIKKELILNYEYTFEKEKPFDILLKYIIENM